jgi:hypothetical protein
MTQDEIIEMANKAYAIDDGKPLHPSALFHLEIFAKLVAQHERSACAKIADQYVGQDLEHNFSALVAHNIRARGKHDSD